MKKSKEANWPSAGVHFELRFSSLKRLETIFVRGVKIILFIMEKGTHNPQFLDSFRRRANARNVSFLISLRWPIHIINPVDKTKLSC